MSDTPGNGAAINGGTLGWVRLVSLPTSCASCNAVTSFQLSDIVTNPTPKHKADNQATVKMADLSTLMGEAKRGEGEAAAKAKIAMNGMARNACTARTFTKPAFGELDDQATRKIALELLRSLVLKSPVDTGRFRANWVISEGSIDFDIDALPDTGVIVIGKIVLDGLHVDETIYITNSLPYGPKLENWSKQAPSGMVRLTVAELPQTVRVAVRATAIV